MVFFSVKEAKYIKDYQIWLKFSDGKNGNINLCNYLDGEIFKPLKNKIYFKKFNIERSTISWENGADFAPEFLYELLEKSNGN
ncbi:DUF2442 domain-containing protein [Rickettsiales bacterium]|nr:DUF2442 domain-containing protein [Rickettsiales bacterium]MDB2550565.1 DUF2442 domain-containing protein [Rickettsiales bacterium]